MLNIIIISAERRPLLDIGLPQTSPHRSVLWVSHPADARSLDQVIASPRGRPWKMLRLPVRGRHSRTFQPQRPSVLRAMCPAHYHLSLAIPRAISVTLVLLRIQFSIYSSTKFWVQWSSLRLTFKYNSWMRKRRKRFSRRQSKTQSRTWN